MSNLKCPHCDGEVCVEVDTTTFKEFMIKEQIQVVNPDGKAGFPTFLLEESTDYLNDRQNILIRCIGCGRRFFQISTKATINEQEKKLTLENFSKANFKSFDFSYSEKPQNKSLSKFILKQRPKKLCPVQ